MRALPGALAVVCGAAVAAVSVSTAAAERPATPDEQTAVVQGLGSSGDDPSCYDIRLSTVDPTWALLTGASPLPRACIGGDGYILAVFDGAEWAPVTSDANDGQGSCSHVDAPVQVALDFKLCRPAVAPAKTTITCWAYSKKGKAIRRVHSKPRNCLTLAPERSLAEAADLRRLKWKNWGKTTATATGRSRALHAERSSSGKYYFPQTRVTVRASNPFEYNGRRYYRTLKLKTKYGHGTIELSGPTD